MGRPKIGCRPLLSGFIMRGKFCQEEVWAVIDLTLDGDSLFIGTKSKTFGHMSRNFLSYNSSAYESLVVSKLLFKLIDGKQRADIEATCRK